MKGWEVEQNDIVSFNGERHKVIEIAGDTLKMIHISSQREVGISKYHSVIMVERPRRDHPFGIEWRAYIINRADETKRRLLKKGMTHVDAVAYINGLKKRDGYKYIIRDKTFKAE